MGRRMHLNDKIAMLCLVGGLGTFASGIIAMGTVHNPWLTGTLLGLGAAGQTANQYLRIKGSPTTAEGLNTSNDTN